MKPLRALNSQYYRALLHRTENYTTKFFRTPHPESTQITSLTSPIAMLLAHALHYPHILIDLQWRKSMLKPLASLALSISLIAPVMAGPVAETSSLNFNTSANVSVVSAHVTPTEPAAPIGKQKPKKKPLTLIL